MTEERVSYVTEINPTITEREYRAFQHPYDFFRAVRQFPAPCSRDVAAALNNTVIQAEIAINSEREQVCFSDHPNYPEPATPLAKRTAADWRHVGRYALREPQPQRAVDAFRHATTLDPSAEAYG